METRIILTQISMLGIVVIIGAVAARNLIQRPDFL